MLGLGVPELIVILVICVLVFGPSRLPEIGGALGKGIRDFKKGFDGSEEDAKKVETTSETTADPNKT